MFFDSWGWTGLTRNWKKEFEELEVKHRALQKEHDDVCNEGSSLTRQLKTADDVVAVLKQENATLRVENSRRLANQRYAEGQATLFKAQRNALERQFDKLTSDAKLNRHYVAVDADGNIISRVHKLARSARHEVAGNFDMSLKAGWKIAKKKGIRVRKAVILVKP